MSTDVSVRVQEAEARLEDLMLRFTEKHPEVVALKQTIADPKAREAKELAELARGGPGTGAIRSLNVNPVYQQIQVQLGQVEVELASFRGAAAQHRSEIASLRRFVDSAPEVEQEYARLNRDYGVTKAQYETLVGRLEQARVSDGAAQNGIIRFEILDPPRADEAPVWPKRSLFMIGGLLFGLLAGVAAALLPHLIRPTIDDTAALARLTGLPVLGSVSAIRTSEQAGQLQLDIRKVAIAGGALVAVGATMIVFGSAGARLIRSLIA